MTLSCRINICLPLIRKGRVWRYQRGNQNPLKFQCKTPAIQHVELQIKVKSQSIIFFQLYSDQIALTFHTRLVPLSTLTYYVFHLIIVWLMLDKKLSNQILWNIQLLFSQIWYAGSYHPLLRYSTLRNIVRINSLM
jgi:hypothetical protein